jgi:hypothetical protein
MRWPGWLSTITLMANTETTPATRSSGISRVLLVSLIRDSASMAQADVVPLPIPKSFDKEMTCLLNLEPTPSPAGAIDVPYGSGISKTHPPTRLLPYWGST